MKRKLLLLIIAGIIFSSSSCDSPVKNANVSEDTALFTEYGISMNYSYIVDNRTGVVYLCHSAGYRESMTVMLNADGTPVTANQIGLRGE